MGSRTNMMATRTGRLPFFNLVDDTAVHLLN